MSDMIAQGLATINNYHWTGQRNKAIRMLSHISKIKSLCQQYSPSKSRPEPVDDLWDLLIGNQPDLSEHFGKNWLGESLNGRSIEVFCDQGMGDTLNLIRYLVQMKERWDCRIVLNNYAYFDKLASLLGDLWYIDEFTNQHKRCDYHTNLFSIPAILNRLDVYYPPNFDELLQTSIPEQPALHVEPMEIGAEFAIGVAWHSNLDNKLGEKKSVPIDAFKGLPGTMFSLLPSKSDFTELPIDTLEDTARAILAMDLVISVDTVVLHLAGVLGKPTCGLLAVGADRRWGDEDRTVWYPSVRLFRQEEPGDWSKPMKAIAACVSATPT